MSRSTSWNPESYAKNARFVSDLGEPLLKLLNPTPGELILDLGCGDGALTEKIAALGSVVIGVDTSLAQLQAAQERRLSVAVINGEQLALKRRFAAVFTNAALHWMKQPERVVQGVANCLQPGGRFVATCYRDDNFSELWKLIDGRAEPPEPLTFNSESGADLLGKRFGRVERRDVEATLVFPTTASMREFVASTIDRAHLAPQVPEIAEPFRVTTHHAIFVAEQPR